MPDRTARAAWEGSIREGKGTMALGSGAFEGPYSFSSRFEDGSGTNPEELIGAAHAGCFSMAFSGALGRAGFEPNNISTNAVVKLGKVGEGFKITRIELETQASVPGIEDAQFQEIAESAKQNCPVSQALAGTEIVLTATLSK